MTTKTNTPAETGKGEGRSLAERAWAPLWHLREEIDDLFEDFYSRAGFGARHRKFGAAAAPGALGVGALRLDVIDNDREIRICAELPGMDEKDVDVSVTDHMLTMRGEKKEEREEGEEGEEGGDFYVRERRFGAFERRIPLPEGIDQDKIEAKFEKGVLTVHLPKTPEAQKSARKIEVKGAG